MKRRISRILQRAGADKRKLSLALMLLAVGGVLWVRLLFQQVPRQVEAGTGDMAETDKTPVDASEAPVPAARQVVRLNLSTNLNRDLFALSDRIYSREQTGAAPAGATKSGPEPVDERQQEQMVRRAAQGLVLQTTILGDCPRAMINGQVVAPGGHIQGFILREIKRRGVVLEMNGVQVELNM